MKDFQMLYCKVVDYYWERIILESGLHAFYFFWTKEVLFLFLILSDVLEPHQKFLRGLLIFTPE